ncbi:hypothetical protein CY35_10G066500 [Sphagnum magellanicum]|jgi:hypothetical protein|nr:hypothetical protein CY35_10G066500 [Sphagnum magellanicum]
MDPLVVDPSLPLNSRNTAEKLPESQLRPESLQDSELGNHTHTKFMSSESELPVESQQPSSDGEWEAPIFDEWESQETRKVERKLRNPNVANVDEKNADNPFVVSYRRERDWPEEMWVTLFSSHLVEIISKCLPNNKLLFDTATPKIPGNDLFLQMDEIRKWECSYRDVEQSLETAVATARLHLGYLLRFLEKEFKNTQTQYNRMMQERSTSWSLLWAFLPLGEKVYYHCGISDELVYGIVYGRRYNKQNRTLDVELIAMDYNGQSYYPYTKWVEVREFKDERSFDCLPLCPMRFVKEHRQQMEAAFLANGKRFYGLAVKAQNSFMHFEGSLFSYGLATPNQFMKLREYKADGRVMVDHRSFVKMKLPSYNMGNASPHNTHFRRMRAAALQQHIKHWASSTSVMPATGLQQPEDSGSSLRRDELPDDESLRLAPAVVYGFSFSLKKWGCFPVTGFSEISFDDHAFDRHQVMSNEVQKNMLLGLVSQHLQDPEPMEDRTNNKGMPAVDPISRKGKGCIFLCYGPPGTGKTLTAESIAEKLHRPLWTVSALELMLNVDTVEESLIEILDIAYSWRAIVLMDEADIYLEKRISFAADPTRNVITGIFLRVLNYNRGVIFLTTNHVTALDDAVRSRISMFIRYHPLTLSQRAKVWETLVSGVGLCDADLEMLAAHELDGHQIHNCIQIAQTWATSCKEPLSTQHVLKVLNMFHESYNDLRDALLKSPEEEG